MRHVILGAAGQLGHEFARLLDGQLCCLTRADADLTRSELPRATLTLLRPDVVVNCAAYNFVDRAEDEPEAALAVNGTGVGELARICAELDCALVHFSSDHVFGNHTECVPFTEEDTPAPVNAYGRSKLAGEELLRSQPGLRYFLIRTCGLYGSRGAGGKGGNFVETILRLAADGQQLRVVNDQVCTPSHAADVAEATVTLLRAGAQGVYHLTNAGSCSWFEFARTILDLAGLRADMRPVTSAAFGSRARRPSYSVLENTVWRKLGLPPLRRWQEALAAYLNERQSNLLVRP
jgi:dTDP-4-dehydrorhamnose reductase